MKKISILILAITVLLMGCTTRHKAEVQKLEQAATEKTLAETKAEISETSNGQMPVELSDIPEEGNDMGCIDDGLT